MSTLDGRPQPAAGEPRHRRLVFMNNYPMHVARAKVASGIYLRTHLWGADALEAAGWKVRYAPWGQLRGRLGKLQDLSSRVVGDVRQQAAALFCRPHQVVFCADQRTATTLCLLRAIGLYRAPTVVVIHHPVRAGLFNRWYMRGIDVAVCLSQVVRDDLLTTFGRSSRTTLVAGWGPDLDSALIKRLDEFRRDGEMILSTGKTRRDLGTLTAALDGTPYVARVYSLEAARYSGERVEVVSPPPGSHQFELDEVLADVSHAGVVAIPHTQQDRLCGLTELNDALAFGKPVVMTRNAFVDIDIEQIGCGIWVEIGDVEGWHRAIMTLMEDRELRAEMGQRGRAFAERAWNYDRYCQQIIGALDLASKLETNRSGRP